MNTPSRIVADPVGLFCPGCTPDERRLRERLLKARDIAGNRVRNAATAHGRALLWMVVETATTWVYALAPLDELEAACRQCVRLIQCAGFAELEASDEG